MKMEKKLAKKKTTTKKGGGVKKKNQIHRYDPPRERKRVLKVEIRSGGGEF